MPPPALPAAALPGSGVSGLGSSLVVLPWVVGAGVVVTVSGEIEFKNIIKYIE